ncbi:MAG TPA: hypothetical protein DD412_04615 [Holosporales bacterium]|nr:hypothetical protein [Holosporales bacterium]
MRFLNISLFFLFIFCVFTLKASHIDENFWQLSGAFFLQKKCYISIRDTRKAGKVSVHNSSMMLVNCSKYILSAHAYNPRGSSRQLRSFACHHFAFCNRWHNYRKLFKDEMYEVDLLNDSYLRSLVVLVLHERLKEPSSFMTAFLAEKILDLLKEKNP